MTAALASIGGATSGPGGGFAASGGTSASFTAHLAHAEAAPAAGAEAASPALQIALAPIREALAGMNGEASALASAAEQAHAAGAALAPGDMIMLSMRANQFLFQCELTSNIANRSSDGLQQLFKEQS